MIKETLHEKAKSLNRPSCIYAWRQKAGWNSMNEVFLICQARIVTQIRKAIQKKNLYSTAKQQNNMYEMIMFRIIRSKKWLKAWTTAYLFFLVSQTAS